MTEDPRIEAVARALCEHRGENPDEEVRYLRAAAGFEAKHVSLWEEWVPEAMAALAAADAAAWRPIGEIRDETYILAFSAGRMTTAFWFDKEDWGGPFWTDGAQRLRNITHFMHLPIPPQEQE